MNKVIFRIKARELPPEQAARLAELRDPESEVEVTIEELDDFADLPADILESQRRGIEERLKSDKWASEEDVEAFFR